APGDARCHAHVVTHGRAGNFVSSSPTGLSPAQVKSAYGFSTLANAGAGMTIAIVDAYDDPSAESDLGTFSATFGLPPCTTQNGYASHFSSSAVSFFVSAGDNGLPAEYPSASPNVISVGGTTLNYSGGALVSETGWSSGGGGCSVYENAASAQSAFAGYTQAN